MPLRGQIGFRQRGEVPSRGPWVHPEGARSTPFLPFRATVVGAPREPPVGTVERRQGIIEIKALPEIACDFRVGMASWVDERYPVIRADPWSVGPVEGRVGGIERGGR